MKNFVAMLDELLAADAEFLLVGGYALGSYGAPRATGDFDLWVRASAENAPKVYRALARFGAPLDAHGVGLDDFARLGTVYQIGLPPQRIDIVTSISGVSFDEVWPRRVPIDFHGRPIAVMHVDDFLRNKRASGRPKDLYDVVAVEEVLAARRE